MSHITRNPQFALDQARHAREWGIINPFAMDYINEDTRMSFDAQPALVLQPGSAYPQSFTQLVDPEVIRVFQTPNKGAQILGETKKGTWIDQTAFFPVIENTGEVSSYGDFNMNGRSDVNANFVQRQSYLFQTILEYGELAEARAGAAKLNWISELQISAAKALDKYMDFIYHFGVAGLQNYGLLNDPALGAALTPSVKAAGGNRWVFNGVINASANEVYADYQALFGQITGQSGGLVDADSKFVLTVPNTVSMALTATNIYGVTVRGLLKESFPNVEVVIDPRNATAAGNVVQLIAKEVDGVTTGYCAFSEKQRDHNLIPAESSYRQKKTAGSWGAIIRYPLAVATMLGV